MHVSIPLCCILSGQIRRICSAIPFRIFLWLAGGASPFARLHAPVCSMRHANAPSSNEVSSQSSRTIVPSTPHMKGSAGASEVPLTAHTLPLGQALPRLSQTFYSAMAVVADVSIRNLNPVIGFQNQILLVLLVWFGCEIPKQIEPL